MKAFCVGFPGAMWCSRTRRSAAQRNITRLVNSVPLSITSVFGEPRISPSMSRTRVTRAPESDVSTSIESDSCVKSSTIVSARIRRPERVMHEVQRPALVHGRHDRSGISTSKRNSTPNRFADLQIRLSINTPQPLDIDYPAVAPNHHVKPPVAKPPALCGKLFKPAPQRAVICKPPALVPEHSSIALRDLTCTAFANSDALANCPHRSTALCGRQKFPSAMIFSASICSN
jgi:hypothetical protein